MVAVTKTGRKAPRVIPGFGLSMGVTLSILSLVVLIPLASLVVFTANMDFGEIIAVITRKRVLASFEVSFIAQLIEAEKVETPQYVTATINDEFVESGAFESTIIKEGDTIEFLYFMGGGQ